MTWSPTYPAAGALVTLDQYTATEDVYVYELTNVPAESALSAGLLLKSTPSNVTAPTSAQAAAETDYAAYSFTPDVGGDYAITVYTFRRIIGASGYGSDPSGEARLVLSSVDTSQTISAGPYVDLPIVTQAGDGGTLRCTIVNDTVRAATIVDTVSEVGRVAALATAVTTTLTALVGVAVSALNTDLQTGSADLRTQYEAHRVDTSGSPAIHDSADSGNASAYSAAASQAAAVLLLNDLRAKMCDHQRNINVHPYGQDLANWPLIGSAETIAQATVLFADLSERVYERHRIQVAAPTCHGSADTTHAMTAPGLLTTAIVAYLDAIAAVSPSVATGEATGATEAAHRYGFRRYVAS